MKQFAAFSVLVAALASPAAAFAQQLVSTSQYVNLRAGPGKDYPIVALLQPGIDISVVGCLSDYRWCDIVTGPDRGWVYAGNIVYPYQSSNVPLLSYGAIIGIGIIAFDLGYYWDQHYRGRPWYAQRRHWTDWPRPGFGGGDRRAHQPGLRFDEGMRRQHAGASPFQPGERGRHAGGRQVYGRSPNALQRLPQAMSRPDRQAAQGNAPFHQQKH